MTKKNTAPEALDPAAFDVAAWAAGLAPLAAEYQLPGGPLLTLEPRDRGYLEENGLLKKRDDESDEKYGYRLAAAHITGPGEWTPELVEQVAKTPGWDAVVAGLLRLCLDLDTQPDQINPRFLRGASD